MIGTSFYQHAGEGTLPLVKLAAAVRCHRCLPRTLSAGLLRLGLRFVGLIINAFTRGDGGTLFHS